jgi:hypothetical protein
LSARKAEDMTAPTTRATPKIALDQRAAPRHDNAVGTILQSGTTPNYVVSGSQTISSPVLMTATQTYCTNKTI